MDPAYPFHNDIARFISWMLERLRDIPDIDWDDSAPCYHSSRDEWHFRGHRRLSNIQSPATNGSQSPTAPSRSSNPSNSRPSTPRQRSSEQLMTNAIIARLSTKSLQLERQYQVGRAVAKSSDQPGKHHLKVLQLLRLQPRNDGEPLLTVLLLQDPGYNALWDMVNYGANWYIVEKDMKSLPHFDSQRTASGTAEVGKTHLPTFLDIAVGASHCVEMLHTGNHVIHAELRGDSVWCLLQISRYLRYARPG